MLSKYLKVILFLCFCAELSAQKLSLVFTDGYIGTVGSSAIKNNSIKSFSTIGISRITFSQEDSDGDGLFTIQGNDIPGDIRIYTDNSNFYTISGAVVWNDKSGSTIESFGLLFSDISQTDTVINTSKGNFTIYVGDDTGTSSNLSLLALNISDPYSENSNISGNASRFRSV